MNLLPFVIWIIFILNGCVLGQLKVGYKFKTSLCDGKNGVLLPIFGSCRGYYICSDGKAVVGSCDELSRFNPLTLHCDNAARVDCPYEISDEDEDSDIDDMESEQLDYDSVELEDPPTTTTTTTTIKPHKQQQRPLLPSPQNNVNINYNMCLGQKNGVALAKADSCTEYFVCKSKSPQLHKCPGKQHFSPTRQVCMKAADARCTLTPNLLTATEDQSGPAITAGFCNDEKENALVPHKDDCGKFMLCSNMMFLVMDCPAGLHFNAAAKRCDYPKVAQCELVNVQTNKNKKKSKKNQNKVKPKLRKLY